VSTESWAVQYFVADAGIEAGRKNPGFAEATTEAALIVSNPAMAIAVASWATQAKSGDPTDENIKKAKGELQPAAGEAGQKGQLEGTPEQAGKLKEMIGVQGEREVRRGEGGTAKVGKLPDGSTVIDYPSGGGDSYPKGTRTIEIQRPSGKANEKWRFPEPKA
jgi:hypothetical protein